MTVYLDACFSGDSHDGMLVRSASPIYVAGNLPEAAGEKLTVLTAASGKQLASWDEEARHGLFTEYLLEALYGQADVDGNGRITAAEVVEYLTEHMTRAARRVYRRRQEATLNGEPGAVLASAVEGAFPARPELGTDGGLSKPAGDATAAAETQIAGGKPDACETASAVGATVLQDGTTLSDWALLAEGRLEQGEYVQLLVEAKGHLRDYCNWKPAAGVLEKAVAGIARELDTAIETDVRSGLSRLSTVLQAAGPQPPLLRLKARAHGLLREYALEEEAYGIWLANASHDHPHRVDVLTALQRVRALVGADAEFAKRLARPFSADAKDEVGWTDLHYAAAFNLAGGVAALIEEGMHSEVRLQTGSLPFGDHLTLVLGEEFAGWKGRR